MFDAIQSATGHPLLDAVMIIVALLLILVIPLTLIALWLGGWKHPAFVVFATSFTAILIAQVLGLGYYHDPPHLQGYETLLENDPENAFPSNHTAAIAGFALGLLYMRFRFLAWLGVAAAGLIAFARIYTGLHFPIDIAGGLLAGFLALAVVVLVRPYVDRLAEGAITLESMLVEAIR